jgi:hypothetical protein
MADIIDYDSMDAARQNALHRRDASLYASLCNELGVEPEDAFLFEQGLMSKGIGIEDIIEQVDSGVQDSGSRSGDIPHLWGIRNKDLEVLSYATLESMFYGIHNLRMPGKMMDALNPDEILAKYVAAGRMKRRDLHLKHPAEMDFCSLYRRMDEAAYRDRSFAKMSHRCSKRFGSAKGEQMQRLSRLDADTRNDFVKGFSERYVPSLRESPSDPDAFFDPNVDGSSKKAYIIAVYSLLKDTWRASREKR